MSTFYLPEASLLTVWLPVKKFLKGLLAHEAISGTSPCPRQSWSACLPNTNPTYSQKMPQGQQVMPRTRVILQ